MKKKRILFLISDTGGGHRASAEAIGEAVEYSRPGRYEIVISDIWKKHLPWPFCELPGTYGWLSGKGKFIWMAMWKMSAHPHLGRVFFEIIFPLVKDSMVRYLSALQPDLVVSVHPLMNHLGVRWLRAAGLGAPFVTVVTDMVSLHPFWICPEVNRCVVPTQEARELVIEFGMPAEKIAVHGQPISLKFAKVGDDRTACRHRLGLEVERPAVLITGGGEGDEQMYQVVLHLARSIPQAQLLVVAGRNETLKEKLERHPWEIPIRIYGFVNNMPELMSAADILLTKAGPGTISEAFAARLPVVLFDYIPGQETGNITYVESHNAGIYVPQPDKIAHIISDWLSPGNSILKAMAKNAAHLARPRASRDIAEELIGLVETVI